MAIAIVTGATGLIGSEAVRFFSEKKFQVLGVDNDMRAEFFGEEASTRWNLKKLAEACPDYRHHALDVRSEKDMERLFSEYNQDIQLIVHCAAQPSHDWAVRDPITDFSVNANGTLVLLEMTRRYCPDATFIYLSTNKVYGDRPNALPLEELATRWELRADHPFYENGIDETMSLDDSTHSLFGVSKAAGDLLVQEYGRTFGMKTACFRGGCLTGSAHSGTELHGFLSYLMICALKKKPYTLYGYQGKQVRDNIHSYDLVNALYHFYRNPGVAKVYNIGGGRHSNCSVLEAIALCEDITGNKLDWTYEEANRKGDHIWWISDVRRFQKDCPDWNYRYDLPAIIEEIYNGLKERM